MEEFFKEILVNYPLIAPIVFVVLRTIPIIIPPVPGIVVDLMGIAIFGWLYGFILAGVGVMAAAMITFYVGRYFREPIVKKFVSLQKIHLWEKQFSERQNLFT